jgi:hypothetical protein
MKDITFRDGQRTVPDHVEDMLSGIETWRYTYEDAMRVANNKLLGDKLDRAQRAMLRDHFKVTL